MNFSFEATWGESKPLEELTRLMEKRMILMRENSYDAAVATIINTLVSLRALTRVARPAKKTKVVVEPLDQYIPSPSKRGGKYQRCLRLGGVHVTGIRRLKWITNDMPFRDLHTYRVIPEHTSVKPYLVVAPSAAVAEDFEQKCAARRKDNYGGLAKTALGIAMAQLSTKNVQTKSFERISRSKLVFVEQFNDGKTITISARDLLNYAVSALPNGRADVNTALMKAANKTQGILAAYLKKYGSFLLDEAASVSKTPFPEVVKRRRSA